MLQANDGALYGETLGGDGEIFKVNPDGTGFHVVITSQQWGGDLPVGGLIQGADRMLYGAQSANSSDSFEGAIFRISTGGTNYHVLHFLTQQTGHPISANGLLQGSDGLLYGTTASGGGVGNPGTVFKLRADGSGYSVISSFSTTGGDGTSPVAPLVQASDGLFYGTTSSGGV